MNDVPDSHQKLLAEDDDDDDTAIIIISYNTTWSQPAPLDSSTDEASHTKILRATVGDHGQASCKGTVLLLILLPAATLLLLLRTTMVHLRIEVVAL